MIQLKRFTWNKEQKNMLIQSMITPYRGIGVVYDRFDERRTKRLQQQYGDNWMSRSVEGKKLPFHRLYLYYWFGVYQKEW